MGITIFVVISAKTHSKYNERTDFSEHHKMLFFSFP
jgi:hypothetical protein